MRIGIIGAMQSEVEALVAAMEQRTQEQHGKTTYWCGIINSVECVVAQSGIGKVAMAVCAQQMIDFFEPDCLINTGVAGGLALPVSIGDIVIASDLVLHDVDVTPLGALPGQIPDMPASFKTDTKLNAQLFSHFEKSEALEDAHVFLGRIASGDQFIASVEQKDRITKAFDAWAAEMEGAALGEVCYLNDVKCCVVRALSDTADGEASDDYPAFEKKAAARMAHMLIEVLPALAQTIIG